LTAYTRGSAWFSFEESDRGHLEAGALADVAVLTADPFEVEPDRLPEISSELTLLGGRPAHRGTGLAGLAIAPEELGHRAQLLAAAPGGDGGGGGLRWDLQRRHCRTAARGRRQDQGRAPCARRPPGAARVGLSGPRDGAGGTRPPRSWPRRRDRGRWRRRWSRR